ncbi:RidA family protein [Sphingomonas sp. H160509]|uniref:RidA family protein n=1 Tax=Sphingomonas sp. H160509 TaxID=2955313 RepID=UPI0020980874|nr:RidA family protein [Sphingomonas sp. H160509]MDD1452161.1 RidA family protein [Sphingomonas sp. H160509]
MTTPSFFITPGYGTRLHDALHYSQAMRIGDRVEISGQGGWNDDLVIPESIEDEIAQAFKNVERTLATAGANWRHVVHVNSYHVGGFPPVINETMARLYRHYMPDRAPIWTQLGGRGTGVACHAYRNSRDGDHSVIRLGSVTRPLSRVISRFSSKHTVYGSSSCSKPKHASPQSMAAAI